MICLTLSNSSSLIAQSTSLAYKYEYTKVTDVRFVKGALDHTVWCATDFAGTQAIRKKEKTTTSVFTNDHFKIDTWLLEDSERPSWTTPIEKITFDQTGIKSYKPGGALAAFQPFTNANDPYTEMYDSVAAGQEIGNLPKFPQYDHAVIDSFHAHGYQILWQGNGDLWISQEIHVIKIKPSVLQVENWYWSNETGDVLHTDYFQIVAGGDTLLRKSLTIDKIELCSGACIRREKKDVYIGYTYVNATPTPRSQEVDVTEQILQVLAYPNPFRDQIELKVNILGDEPYQVQLFNQQGTRIFDQTLLGERNVLDLAHLPSGCYALSIQSARGATRTKIVKI
jgi:Secretion system C-terminal sorting domain